MNIQQTAHRDLAEKNALTEENTQLKENENNVREGMRFKLVQSRSILEIFHPLSVRRQFLIYNLQFMYSPFIPNTTLIFTVCNSEVMRIISELFNPSRLLCYRRIRQYQQFRLTCKFGDCWRMPLSSQICVWSFLRGQQFSTSHRNARTTRICKRKPI